MTGNNIIDVAILILSTFGLMFAYAAILEWANSRDIANQQNNEKWKNPVGKDYK